MFLNCPYATTNDKPHMTKTDVTPAILSRDFVALRYKMASVTWRVAQLLNSRATPLPIRAALYSVQLRRENAVNADWSILVYAT